MYTIRITFTDGRVSVLPTWFDEEWAHRYAGDLRRYLNVANAEVIPWQPEYEKGSSECCA